MDKEKARSTPLAATAAEALSHPQLGSMDQRSSAPARAPAPAPASALAHVQDPSASSSPGHIPYIPQFSASTELILQRMRHGKVAGSLDAALASASSVARTIQKSAWEDARRHVLLTMDTSMTMPMPALKPTPRPAARRPGPVPGPASRPMTNTPVPVAVNDPFQLRHPALPKPVTPAARTTTAITPAPTPTPATMTNPMLSRVTNKATRGTKRKRIKNEDSDASSLSGLSDSDSDSGTASKDQAAAAPPMMTKSGRQVQKPTQYNPAQSASSASSAAQKRKHYGKRTPDQALCKVCTRGLSPAHNQIVFCDGCNLCWHQQCHDPYIDDAFVSDESRSWFCSACMAKRERQQQQQPQRHPPAVVVKNKKPAAAETVPSGVSWASKSEEHIRRYLSGLPQPHLVDLLMRSIELHPDLPIFPAFPPSSRSAGDMLYLGPPRSGAGGAPGVSSIAGYASSQARLSRKPSTPDSHHQRNNGNIRIKLPSSAAQAQADRESSVDSVPPAWPKVGQGCLKGMRIAEEDLEDENDFEAFSVTEYDKKGKKMRENGMPV